MFLKFLDWHTEVFGTLMDFHTVNSDELARKLRKFYCGAKPKDINKSNMMDAQTGYYHNSTLKNIRWAINRHLNDIGRSVEIVRDKEFKQANQTLDGMLKKMTQIGSSRLTKHKEVIIQRICPKLIHIYGQPSSLPWFFVSVFVPSVHSFRLSWSWISPSAAPWFLQHLHRWKQLRIRQSSTWNRYLPC